MVATELRIETRSSPGDRELRKRSVSGTEAL